MTILPEFREVHSDASDGLVLKPLLHAYLYNAQFPRNYSVDFKAEDTVRKPDGLFHPSAHPLWPERMLYYYLTEPDGIIPEQMMYMNTLSVTMGKALHGFVGMCLKDQGVLMTEAQLEAEGIPYGEDGEPIVFDQRTGSTGHIDGLSNLYVPRFPTIPRQVYEFKTSNEMKLRKVEDNDLDWYIDRCPDYYGQNQDYMRITGYRLTLVLFMSLGYPWPLKEFHVPYNPKFGQDLERKYLSVRSAAAEGVPPIPCCNVGSKESKNCPARGVCPIGRGER